MSEWFQDFITEDFDFAIQVHGCRLRWFSGEPWEGHNRKTGAFSLQTNNERIEDGRVYREKTPADGEPFRALIVFAQKTMVDNSLGIIAAGDAKIQFMRERTPFVHGDKLILLDYEMPKRAVVARGSTTVDVLNSDMVSGIQSARQGDRLFTLGVDYQLDSNQTGVEWLEGGEAPDSRENYSVTWSYHPTMYYSEKMLKPDRKTGNGEWMPVRGLLCLKYPGAL